ncbi:MAG: EamA family transporter [Candidatus Aenigmatarchaeota archaeon]
MTGLILFYKSAKTGKISIASAIMSTKIMWTMILASVILEEKLSIKEITGIILILTGIILIQKGG